MRWWRPPATLRWRLTALYGALFLAAGAALLTITYLLVSRQLHGGVEPPEPSPPFAGSSVLRDALAQQRDDTLHQLIVQSAVALGLMAVIAGGLGWIVAGRALRPLRDITATAQRLSTRNLDERIDLRGPHGELKELADTFDAMLSRLGDAFEAQRRFVANASHELRTPLTVQRAAIDVALADPHPTVDSLTTMALRVRAATERHEHLIASLLLLARGQGGIARYDDVDLAAAVEAALAAVRDDAGARGVRVAAGLRPATLLGDRTLLERLAGNLLDNAVRYNVPDGWLTVDTGDTGDGVVLRVTNSGPVVPPDRVDELFQPFRRLAPDRSGTRHGLGLSIVASIAAAHHGTCAAEARPDGGLDITVTLPASP
jgi:signal transduction histidine kinase